MGFGHRAMRRFATASADHLAAQERLSDLTSGFSTASRVFRLIIQSALLGIGAYLVIAGEMSAGAIIASSIASSRAFAPIEVAIANWKGFIAARQAATRLNSIFTGLKAKSAPLELPAPVNSLALEGVAVGIPGSQRVALSNASFELKAGQALAVIGPSAAGKSSLARAIVGVWGLSRGTVRLDGAPLDRWSIERLGEHIGYLPQDVELFDGTITDNIARFEENPDSRKVIEAAQAAGVHEMILRLPEGYETQIGERGSSLSAGQRQRIALARALYGKPFLVVLDEPNSNLDADGEDALARAIQSVRARGGIVVVVAHRPGVLAVVDTIAVVGNGQITAFGPRDEILQKAVKPGSGLPGQATPRPARPAAQAGKPAAAAPIAKVVS
jgi:ATP-binding cassette subfamily C protein